jgi:hypothetical protein
LAYALGDPETGEKNRWGESDEKVERIIAPRLDAAMAQAMSQLNAIQAAPSLTGAGAGAHC